MKTNIFKTLILLNVPYICVFNVYNPLFSSTVYNSYIYMGLHAQKCFIAKILQFKSTDELRSKINNPFLPK